jgi:hypothetical protein
MVSSGGKRTKLEMVPYLIAKHVSKLWSSKQMILAQKQQIDQ